MNWNLTLSGCTHPGTVRHKNDDCFCVGRKVYDKGALLEEITTEGADFQEYGLLCAVADGMGGYAGGDVASRAVLEQLSELFYARSHRGLDARGLCDVLQQDVEAVKGHLNELLRREKLEEAGTTLAGLALLSSGVGVIFHCGDSRVLRGSGGYVRSLTVDHTPLGEDVAHGRVDEAGAADSPLASRVSRALGLVGNTEVEFQCELEWAPGDTFLIATDGFAGLGRGLTVSALRRFMYQRQDQAEGEAIADHAEELVAKALQEDGSDNTTLVLIDVREATGSVPEIAPPEMVSQV